MDIRGAVDAAVPTNIIAAKAAEVRANKVNWQSYLQGQMISSEDCEFIQRFEMKRSLEEKQEMLQTEGSQCAKTFINLMTHISKEQTVQYILTVVDDTLQAARIIAKLAAWGKELMEGSDLNYYFNWIKTQLSSQVKDVPLRIFERNITSMFSKAIYAQTFLSLLPLGIFPSFQQSSQYVQCVAGCLQLMLRVNEYRFAWVEADGVNCIMGVLSNKCGFQLQYQMIFSIWLLAFSPQMCEHLRRYNIIPVLSDILQESVKEKVTRIILAAFRGF
ncbi:hypothetical protein E2I00_010569 [Balaenoptera physalus]|uniref:V-type proton ATPase subunit H n=1 Tax=Balaenoptera physalus TaxID=9770 RepID=A0A643C0B4_BALPH|nr:hypothetical protein E2I00_010569 [Balaenoptera physalus]